MTGNEKKYKTESYTVFQKNYNTSNGRSSILKCFFSVFRRCLHKSGPLRERYVFVLPLREIDIFLYGKSTAVSLQQNDNFVVFYPEFKPKRNSGESVRPERADRNLRFPQMLRMERKKGQNMKGFHGSRSRKIRAEPRLAEFKEEL